MRHSIILLCALILSFLSPLAAGVTMEDIIKERDFSTFRLSPDGSHLAFVGPVQEGYRNIYVIDLATMESKLITGESANVNGFFWVNNERIIYSTDGSNRVYNGVYGIDRDGSNARVLIEPVMQSIGSAFSGISVGGRMFSILGDDDEHVLVYDRGRRREFPDISKLNVYTGRQTSYFTNPGDFRSFVMDGDGVIRFAYTFEENGESAIHYRASEKDDFEILHVFPQDHISYSVEGFDKSGEFAYVLTNHLDNTVSLYKLKLEDMSYEKIFSDPIYDLNAFAAGGDLIFSPKTGRLLGLTYEGAKPVNKWFIKQLEQLQAIIDEAYPDTVNQVISSDDNLTRFIVASLSDRQPYIYRMLTVNPLQVVDLASSKPWIKPEELPRTRPIEFTARDGRLIHGYLTLPTNYIEGESVPLVVMPHGGPWARDVWGFRSHLDSMRLMPAINGWAVLEVNFRGSTGYGTDHLLASYKQPHTMNHDVEDGVRWAVSQGYADEKHLGIMGASWGGYATMYGITMTPDLYRFGINIFGVVDIPRQINWYRLRTKWQGTRDSGFEAWARRIGNPDIEEDRAMLESASPINFVDRIKADLLIYHGLQDANVDIEQSRILRSRLNSANVEFTWISKADEHHSIRNIENRRELYLLMEELFRKHGKQK